MTQATNRWKVGAVTVTKILEQEIDFPPGMMFAGLSPEQVGSVGWLSPSYVSKEGNLRISVHAYVIESKGVRIIVDTCVGNDKPRSFEPWNQMKTPFLDRLAEAGFPPESIDFVLCTHLHIDHVGWNTRWDRDRWVPTFPNAKYLFGRREWSHWQSEAHGLTDVPTEITELMPMDVVVRDSIEPIIAAGMHQLVESDHRITDEVSLFPTPGHTPGHVSVAIHSGGEEAAIAGDVMHHPIQLADPSICALFDHDRAAGQVTRRTFIGARADRDVLVFGTHFATPTVGKIVSEGQVWRFVGWEPGQKTGGGGSHKLRSSPDR